MVKVRDVIEGLTEGLCLQIAYHSLTIDSENVRKIVHIVKFKTCCDHLS